MSESGRYASMFRRLSRSGQGAFVPYLTLGDPAPERTLQLVDTVVEAGADALELGIPFSDPVADGPAIQASTRRALRAGTTPELAFELVERIRRRHPSVPLGLLVYAHLVVGEGRAAFFRRTKSAGFDSILVADLPSMEAESWAAASAEVGLDLVLIAPPNAEQKTVERIAELGSGYVYVVTRAGPTGEGRPARAERHPHFELLQSLDAPPTLVGFGVSEPVHVRRALLAGADGAISGSAVARRVAGHLGAPDLMVASVREFVSSMKRAACGAPHTALEE